MSIFDKIIRDFLKSPKAHAKEFATAEKDALELDPYRRAQHANHLAVRTHNLASEIRGIASATRGIDEDPDSAAAFRAALGNADALQGMMHRSFNELKVFTESLERRGIADHNVNSALKMAEEGVQIGDSHFNSLYFFYLAMGGKG